MMDVLLVFSWLGNTSKHDYDKCLSASLGLAGAKMFEKTGSGIAVALGYYVFWIDFDWVVGVVEVELFG